VEDACAVGCWDARRAAGWVAAAWGQALGGSIDPLEQLVLLLLDLEIPMGGRGRARLEVCM
jgi:hypothetical protein